MYMESVSLFQSINPIVSLSNNRKETEKRKRKGKGKLNPFFSSLSGVWKEEKSQSKET